MRELILALALATAIAPLAAAQEQVDTSLDSLLQTPVSTAGKYTQSVRDAAASITIVTSEQIADNGWTELEELLATVPGLFAANDRTTSHLGVRGFDRLSDFNNRVLVLIDGHTINDPVVSSGPNGAEAGIDLATLERVEIMQGSGSTLYGSSAMFAVVNLITKSATEAEGVRVNVGAGSYGDRRLSAGVAHRFPSGLGVLVDGNWGRSDGPDLFYPEYQSDSATGGHVRGQDFDRRYGARLKADYRGFVLHGQFSRQEAGVPTGAYGATFGDPLATQVGNRAFLEVRHEEELGGSGRLQVRMYTDFNRFQRTIPFPGFSAGYEIKSNTIGGEASLRWDLSTRHRLTLGTQYRDNVRVRVTASALDGLAPVVNAPYSVVSGFAVDEFDLTPWLTILGGISHDRYSSGARITAPRGAAIIRPDRRTTLKLIYGQAFREPTVLERVAGSEGIANPDLRPERINSYELVVQRQVARGLLATGTAFYYDVDDLVETVLDPSDSLLHYQNAGSIRAHGLEANLQARLPHGHSGYLSWSHTVASNENDDVPLQNSPRELIKLGLVSPVQSWLTAAAEVQFESSRRTVAGTETDPFVIANLNFNLYPLGHPGPLSASLRISNLFNTSYAAPGGRELRQASILQDGRNLMLSIGTRF